MRELGRCSFLFDDKDGAFCCWVNGFHRGGLVWKFIGNMENIENAENVDNVENIVKIHDVRNLENLENIRTIGNPKNFKI